MITTPGKSLCLALAFTTFVGCAKPDSAATASPSPSSTATDVQPTPSSTAPTLRTDGGFDMPLGNGGGDDSPPRGSTGSGATDSGLPDGGASDAGTTSSGSGGTTVPTQDKACILGGPPPATPGETLVYADEFDGAGIDGTKWNVYDANRAHGTILNSASSDMVQVQNGSLQISTDRNASDSTFPYKGGFIDTLGKFSRTYGKYELRARFPYANGVWYAIWATAATQALPEIDLEVTNVGATQAYFVDHWAAPPLPGSQRRAYSVSPPDASDPGTFDFSAFHTYTMIWKPGFLTLAIDGDVKLTRNIVGVPDLPLVWKVNSWAGGWVGAPDDSVTFPVTFEVDYFRVYRLDGLIADPSIRVSNKQSAYKNTDTIEVAVADFDEACVHVDLYDGGKRVSSLAAAPYSFSLSGLGKAPHSLSFVATDGVRSTITSFDTVIN